ncbi:MAG: putative Ig domain-containing protein [Phycisphaeraceae bacterium]
MKVRNAAGSLVAPYATLQNLPGSTDSYILIDLPIGGEYTLEVAGQNGSSGGFTIDAHLIGDLDGDRIVDIDDRNALITLVRNRQYLPEADANRDGMLLSLDTTTLLRNFGTRTNVAPLDLSVLLDPGAQLTINGEPLTNIADQTVRGITSPDIAVMFDQDHDGDFDSATTSAGDGIFDFPVTLVEGDNTLLVKASDSFGQSRSATLAIVLDTTPPSVGLPDLIDASDTGTSQTDNITRDNTPTFNVTSEPGSVVTLFVDGSEFLTATADVSGLVSFAIQSPLADGDHIIHASASDALGNTSVSASLIVTIDTQAPAITLLLDPASDTEPSGDNTTAEELITLTGNTEANREVLLFAEGDLINPIATTTSDAAGGYLFDNITLNLGDNLFAVRTADVAGNTGEASLTVTRVESDVPVIVAALANDTGRADLPDTATDGLTSDPTVTGTITDANAITQFRASLNGGPLVDALAALTGNAFTFDRAFYESTILGSAMTDGDYTLTLDAIDEFGNASNLFTLTFTLDTAAPIISLPDLLAPSDTGTSNTDNLTRDATPDFSVITEADALVTLVINGSDAGSTTAGTPYLFNGVGPLTEGDNTIAAEATDLAGNTGKSGPLNVTLDTTPPAISAPDLRSSSDSGPSDSDNLTNENEPTIDVAAEAGSVVELFVGGVSAGSTVAAGGVVSFILSLLPDGQHSLTATATDAAGNLATSSATTITIDTQNPAITLLLDPASDTDPSGDNTTTQELITLSGATEAGLVVSLFAASDPATPLAMTSADGGTFAFTGIALTSGENSFIVRTTDAAGNTGEAGLTVIREDGQTVVLVEGSDFTVQFQSTFTVPEAASTLAITFDALLFDSSDAFINDAFEIALVDAQGRSLVHTATGGSSLFDAAFNLTQNQSALLGVNTQLDGQTVLIDLTHIAPGTQATLIARLVNNDADTQSTVSIVSVEVLEDGGLGTPVGAAANFAPASPAAPVNFASLSDVTPSLAAQYHTTTFGQDSGTLAVGLSLLNIGAFAVDGPVVVIVSSISDPSISVANAHGLTPNGQPYFLFDSTSDGTLNPGEQTLIQSLRFRNPGSVQFTYDLQIFGQLNGDPSIISTPPNEVIAGDDFAYVVAAVDPDGDVLSFELLTAPDGMTIDSGSGAIEYAPESGDVGQHDVLVRVTDGRGGSAAQAFTLSVRENVSNRPPVISSTPPVEARVGTDYEYAVQATDIDGDALSFALIASPAGMTIDAATGLIEWSPTADQLGDHAVTVTVTDGEDTATQTFEVLVIETAGNQAPIIITTPTVTFNLPGEGNAALGDVDPIALTLSLSPGQMVIQDVSITLPTDADEAGFADIIIVVDESGSMAGEHAFITEMVLQLNAALEALGIGPNRFALAGFAGGTRLFNVDQAIETTDVRIDVFGPDGALVDTINVTDPDALFADVTFDTVLPIDGEYTFVVRALDAANLTFDRDLTTVSDTPVAVSGLNAVHTGTLAQGELQNFALSLNAGMMIYIDSLAGSSLADVTLTGPTGDVLIDGERLTSDRRFIRINRSGDYTLTVGNTNAADQSFSIRVLDADAVALAADTPTGGTLAPLEATLFAFQGVSGDIIRLDNLGPAGAQWGLFDSAGVRLINDLSGFQNITSGIEATLDSSGTHYVAVINGSGTLARDFNFSMHKADVEVTTINLGETFSGVIAAPGDQTLFSFQGTAGQRLYYDGFEGLIPQLLAPDGSTMGIGAASPIDFREPVTLTEDGTYFVRFDPASNTLGTFTGRLLNVADATPLQLDADITGTFALGRETTLFSFNGLAGQRLFLDGAAGTTGEFDLFDSSNNRIAGNTLSLGASDIILPQDGTYVLSIQGTGAAGNPFGFRLSTPETHIVPLALGDEINDTISEAGERFHFTFEGVAGQVVYYDGGLSGVNSSLLDARIIAPSGKTFATTSAFNDIVPVVITETGTHHVRINGEGDFTGGFGFRLLDRAAAPALNLAGNNSGTLANGRATQLFQFTGSAGQRLSFDSLSSSGTGRLKIYEPDGSTHEDRPLSTDFTTILPSTGTYLLAIEGQGATPVSFNFDVSDITDAPIANAGFDTPISGVILAGTSQVFNFDASAGTFAIYDALLDGMPSTLRVTLTSPGGALILNNRFASELRGQLDLLPESGTYALKLTSTAATDQPFAFQLLDAAAATPLVLDAQTTGSIDPGQGMKLFTFSASAGDRITFISQAAGSGTWGITGIDGTQVVTFTSLTTDRTLDVPADGSYTLVLRGNDAANPVAFDFTAITSEQSITPITVGNVISGALSEPGERDYYTVDLIAGQTIYFDGLTSDDQFGIDKRIFDPFGQQLASNNATDDVMLSVVTSGTYRIEIFGQNADDVGAYSFELEDVSLAAGLPLDAAQAINLANGLNTELFTFTAAAGDRLFFDVTASTGSATGTLRLWGPDVSEVAIQSFGTDFETVIATGGTYIVQVQGRNPNAAATINFSVITPQTTTTPLNLNDIITGSISESGERDVFTFTGTKGQELYLDSLGGTTSFAFDIFSELNQSALDVNLIFTGGDTGPFALPMDGTYRIVIDGTGAATGDYSFRLIDADVTPVITDLLAGTIHNNIAAEVFRVQGNAGDVITIERNREFGAFGTAQEISDLTSVLQVGFSGTEDGYAAVDHVLAFSDEFRPGAARNVILITDEDRDNTKLSLTFSSMVELLESNNALLNVIVDGNFEDSLGNVAIGMDSDGRAFVADGSGGFTIDPAGAATGGFFNTLVDYVNLAFANGGGAFDLKQLRAGGIIADSFANAFIDIKAEEILQQAGQLEVIVSDPTVLFENQTGVLNGIGAGDIGEFTVKFTGNGVSRSFDLLFVRPQTGVIVGSIPVTLAQDYFYDAAAIDPDGDDVTFALLSGPTGATIDAATGVLTFVPDSAGVFDFTIEARDSRGGISTQTFSVDVTSGQPNVAPVFTSPPPAQAVVGLPLSHQVTAEDVDGDALTFFLLQAPDGMAIDTATGLLEWSPTNLQLGDQAVQIRVIDGRGGQATQSFTITVVADAANQSPVFVSAPPTDVVPGESLIYSAKAIDPDNDALTYDLALSPQGMAIDAQSGKIVWTPEADQFGIHKVIVRVRDGRGGFALQTFDLTVAGDNSVPVITSTPPPVAVTGLPYQYQVTAQDAEGDAITFHLDAAPANMFIDGTDGLITFTPEDGQLGDQLVTVIARDARGGESSQTFTLSVLDVNDNEVPVFVSSPRDHVALGRTYLYRAVAEDVDGDQLLFTLDLAPAGMAITSDGLLDWSPTAAQFGLNNVTVRVSDGRGGIATQSFTIDVRSQEVNTPPTITSMPPATAIVGETFAYDITATDAENDPIIFLLADAPAGMSIDPLTGKLRWNPKLDQLGPVTITIEAIDGQGAETSQEFTLNVIARNAPPSIISVPPIQAGIGQPYVYDVNAIDGNGDVLTYALTQNPAGMTIDLQTGLINWTPQAGQEGLQSVTVFVSDGAGGEATQKFKIGVQAALNDPPTITSQPTFVANRGELYTYDVNAIDPDGDDLTFALDVFPIGMTIDAVTGLIEWTPAIGQEGPQQVRVIVSDTAGNAALQGFTVTTLVDNAGPSIDSAPPSNFAATGLPYRYDVLASDPDGDALSFTLTEAPDGMTIDAFGRLRWTPSLAQLGDHNVIIRVTDPLGSFATQSFTLTAQADVEGPVVRIDLSQNPVDPGTQVEVIVRATDRVGVVSLDVTFDGVALVLDANGRAVVTPQTVGPFDIVVTARDASGNVTVETVTLNVTDTSDVDAPFVFINTPSPGDTITNFLDVIGTVQDDNLASYTLSIAPLGSDVFTTIATGGANVDDALLGVLDPTLLENGGYRLRLLAEDLGGLQSSDVVIIDIGGTLKLGNFTLSFTDMAMNLSGVPIHIIRHYDSLDANRNADFGFGWRLELQDFKIATNLPDPSIDDDLIVAGFREGTRVYLTRPDGIREGFTFQPRPDGPLGGFLGIFVPHFVPDEGVKSTLTVDDVKLRFNPSLGEYQSYVGLLPYNPASDLFGGTYTLTTKENLAYKIDAATGLVRSVTDLNGVRVTFDESGIESSHGPRVEFERDAQGRLTALIDPTGKRVEYEYSAAGDLIAVTDREDNVTRFLYSDQRPHFLEEVIDPLGRTGVRSEYNDDGRLIRLIDTAGGVTEISYDPDNSIQTVTDRLGHDTTVVYDTRGNVISRTDALGHTTTYQYDAADNLLVETDPLGRTFTRTYNAKGHVLSWNDFEGNTRIITVDSHGFALSTTNGDGETYLYSRDADGNLLFMTNPAGEIETAFTYDGNGNILSQTDADGNTTQYTYNSRGNLISAANALGETAIAEYDANQNIVHRTMTRTRADGSVETLHTRYQYDGNGEIIGITDMSGIETAFEMSPLRQVTAVNLGGRVTSYELDEEQNLTAKIFPDGTREEWTFDAEGKVVSHTNRDGHTTHREYDAVDNLIRIIHPDGSFIARTYDAVGRMLTETDERGHVTTYAYEPRRQIMTDPLGNVTIHEFNGSGPAVEQGSTGDVIRVIDALGRVTQYDVQDDTNQHGLGTVTTIVHADGSTTTHTLNSLDQIVAQTDPLGNLTQYTYDALDQLTAVTNAANGVTSYTYDERRSIRTITDANGHTRAFEYNSGGLQTSQTLPLGQVATALYDAFGNMTSMTDFNGNTTTFQYDINDRLIAKTFQDGTTETYAYSAQGYRTQAGGDTYSYNNRGWLITETKADGRTISYTYDAAGNRTSVTTTVGTTLYSYDALNRLATVTDPDGGVTQYTYDAVGMLASETLANGVVTTYVYDALNQLVSMQTLDLGETAIASYDYTRNAAGLVVQATELDGRTVDYGYDALLQLVSESISDPVLGDRLITYTYDPVGNRLTRTDSLEGLTAYVYDANDRLLTETGPAGVITYAYDDNGNQLSKSGAGFNVNYTYDFENQLLRVDNAGSIIEYTYDADGLRTRTTVDGADVTNYLVDKNRPHAQVLVETDETGVTMASYVHGVTLISMSRPQSGTSYYLHDGQMSVRALTDAAGIVTDTYTYDAAGRLIDSTGATPNDYLFTGEAFDAGADLYYLRARYNDVSTGRFISSDPFPGFVARPDSLHRYIYASNDPVNHADPSGRFTLVGFAATAWAASVVEKLGYKILSSHFNYVANSSALVLAAAMAAKMDGGGSHYNFYRYFGQQDIAGNVYVLDTWTETARLSRKEFNFMNADEDDSTFAYVTPGGELKIFVTPLFYKLPLAVNSYDLASRADVFLHEVTHETTRAIGLEYYGHNSALALANSSLNLTIRNADSYRLQSQFNHR